MGVGMIGTVFFMLGFLLAGLIAILIGSLFALSMCKTLKEILQESCKEIDELMNADDNT